MSVYENRIGQLENTAAENAGSVYDHDFRFAFNQYALAGRSIGAVNAFDLSGEGLVAFEAVEPADLVDAPFSKKIEDGPNQGYETYLGENLPQPQLANPIAQHGKPRCVRFNQNGKGTKFLNQPIVNDPCRWIIATEKDHISSLIGHFSLDYSWVLAPFGNLARRV